MAALTRALYQGVQHARAYTLAAPRLQHRHAAYVSVRQQPSGCDCGSIFSMGERMIAVRVLGIHLKLRRHALFTHEYELAYAAGVGAGVFPTAQANGNR